MLDGAVEPDHRRVVVSTVLDPKLDLMLRFGRLRRRRPLDEGVPGYNVHRSSDHVRCGDGDITHDRGNGRRARGSRGGQPPPQP